MPNHVINRLEFDCTEERLKEILSSICYDDNAEAEAVGIGTVDFNKIIPMPQSLEIECGSRTDRGIDLYLTSINPFVTYFGNEKMDNNTFLALNERLNAQRFFIRHNEYLTLEELKRLADTPCDIPVLRRAAIFSCFTRLRVSDIMQFEWKHIVKAPDGGWCMRIRTEKTETEATLPISEEALSYCGKRKKDGKVFEDFARGMLTAPLKRWLERAGITKHITFHCFRHTFATLQLAMGTDLYTVSKMLTHRFISTTQIYADIMDLEKRKSANAISLK